MEINSEEKQIKDWKHSLDNEQKYRTHLEGLHEEEPEAQNDPVLFESMKNDPTLFESTKQEHLRFSQFQNWAFYCVHR